MIQTLVSEEHSNAALSLIGHLSEICAPALLWYETGNALITLHRRGFLSAEDSYKKFIQAKDIVIINIVEPNYNEAFKLAKKLNLTLYDTIYVQLAKELQLPLFTADMELCQKADREAEVIHISKSNV